MSFSFTHWVLKYGYSFASSFEFSWFLVGITMAGIVLCVCGEGKERSTPLAWDFLQLSFVSSQQCYKRCSLDWFLVFYLFSLYIYFAVGVRGMQLYVRKQPQGERNTRNLVVTFFLAVLVECFSALVWSGPGFGWKAFSSFRGLWGSKKRDDNSHVGIAVTFYCISLIGFIPSGLLYWNGAPWKGIISGVINNLIFLPLC